MDGRDRRLTTHKVVLLAQISQTFLGMEFAFQSSLGEIKSGICV